MALALAAALPALLYAPRLRAAGPPLAVLSPTRAPPRTAVAGCAAAAGPVAAEELSDEVLLSIVLQAMPDQEVNDLTWRCLGYRPTEAGGWDASEVFPNWRKKYPAPPDLVGVTRTYSREVDEPVLRAVQALQRSVPREHKDRLKPTLRPLGWKGFKMAGLTPNMTRRAQVSTWLLYYRKELRGVPLETLLRRKQERAAAEVAAPADATVSPATGTTRQSVI
uniref:Uncharacterized protein n=1 Tax=Emiliania huxleyi TaxID=2903 RepID=A0A6T0A5I1_EMIHU|mmetsp:Transcript_40039/g.118818  ORF Transcript_40039/g.118818 Transcript_40039/m.118818 type:complete len:222 (+) Transcript_40039:43-708(+)